MSQSPHSQPQSPAPAMPDRPAPEPRRRRTWVAGFALVLVVGAFGSACGGADDDVSSAAATGSSSAQEPAPAPPSEAVEAPPVASTPPPAPSAPAAPEPDPGVDFVMPAFVGLDLQTAQNLVQTHGVFLSVSHDLLGSRNQVIDSNWVVCTQNIAPGQQVTGDVEGAIDFGVVKREERCP